MNIFPMQIELRVTRRVDIGHNHAAMVCALIKHAAPLADLGHGMPPGFMPNAVEIGRMTLEADEPFAFGLQVWGSQEFDSQQRFERLVSGLQQLGRSDRLRMPTGATQNPIRSTMEMGSRGR